MKILAVETATLRESVALFNEGRAIEINKDVKSHSVHLLRKIDVLLKKCGVELKDLNYLAVSIGPGSFTGIRIGFSTMQGLAQVLKVPLIGVPTLDALAESIKTSGSIYGRTKWVCPLIQAKREEVYTAIFALKDKKLKRVSEYQCLPIMDLLKKIKNNKKILSPVFFFGDTEYFKTSIQNELKGKAVVMPDSFSSPGAGNVARLANAMIKGGMKRSTPFPLYVKSFLAKKVKYKDIF